MRVSRHRQLSSGESKEKNDMTKEEMEEYGVRLIDHVLNNIYFYFYYCIDIQDS